MRMLLAVVLVALAFAVQADTHFKEMSTVPLCPYYVENPSEEVFQELASRGYLSAFDLELVKERRVDVGMSRTALECVKGYPDETNTTNSASGARKQLIYQACSTCKREYVYVQDHKVVGHQY